MMVLTIDLIVMLPTNIGEVLKSLAVTNTLAYMHEGVNHKSRKFYGKGRVLILIL